MGLSVNTFLYAGNTDFDLNFALGYTSQTDITCYKDGPVPIDVQFDWLTENKVRVDDTNLAVGDTLVFRRTVSKTSLPVDLKQPSNLTRENVETAVLHSLYAFHELIDGRFGDLVEVNDAVYGLVEEAVTVALSNFLFSADFKQDMVFNSQLDAPKPVHWNSGGYSLDTADAYFEVLTAPQDPVELLLYHNSQVIYAVTVQTDGTHTVNTTAVVETIEGSFTQGASAGLYSTGLEYACVLPVKHTSVLDFDKVLSDYVALFEQERNA